ncbi:hypothetical protein PsYK624_072360 [Phanerochaete sordida]|uniref:Uncharacterized protein n=1 Tax=Phanerochaete sordida TaxID=48140 RepID=A0A9P3GA20_9APHY|nr:hypothetical protein PsYK624_072360 [Phanerochaete sordida]
MLKFPPTILGLRFTRKVFESRNGDLTSDYYASCWFKAVDHFTWVAPFFAMAETQPAPQATEGAAETIEDAWAHLLALADPFETASLTDDIAWKFACLVALFALPAADVALCDDTSSDSDDADDADESDDSDDSFDVPATPAADLSLACYSATSIFIDGEVIPAATPEDRQLAFKQRVLARAGFAPPSPSPAPRSGTSVTGPLVTGALVTGPPHTGALAPDTPSKALSASARSFTPSAETIAYASYMRRNPGDARGTAKLFQMRARAQACVG